MKRGLLVLVLSGSCTQASPAAAPSATKAWRLPAAPLGSVELDPRDQYQLVDEIVAARGSETDRLMAELDAVRESWEGRRFRWDVALSVPLCRADGCSVLPFDHGRRPGAIIVQGWLPQLELDEAQRAGLLASCAAYRTCVFTVEATLRQLNLAVDQPTSLAMFDVEASGFREAEPGESWVRRRPPRRADVDPNRAHRRTRVDRGSERG